MQAFRALKNAFSGGPSRAETTANGEEVAQLPEGSLHIVRSNSPKGGKECLYPNALATIQRTDAPFHYQLVIARAYAEGEAELLDDIDDDDEESRVFAIDESLGIKTSDTEDKERCLSWRDLEEGEGASYEFRVDKRTDPRIFEAFLEAVLRGIWEQKNNRLSTDITGPQLAKMYGLQGAVTSTAVSSPKKLEPLPSSLTGIKEDEYLNRESAVLGLWSNENGTFEVPEDIRPDGEVEVRIVQVGQWVYYLIVKRNGNSIIGHQITSELNGRGNLAGTSFTWNYGNREGNNDAWILKFSDLPAYHRFTSTITQCFYEVENAMDWTKLKDIEREYVINAMTDDDTEMTDAEAEDEVEGALAEESESTASEDESDHEAAKWEKKKKSKNSGLAVGYKGIAVVLRGDQLGIFKETTDGNLVLGGTVNEIKGPGKAGKAFEPTKVMLHDQDRTLIMMNPNNQHSLYQMDIETGKVVEEWKVHEDIAVNAMTPLDKLAQMTSEQTLLGVSHNALFQIDPRLSGNKMVNSNMKQYVTKNKFSSLATTEDGHIAVASEKGEIRLFDALGKNAKTALPALGDPIRGIDATKDGRWIIATCKTYLLLIDTRITSGKYEGSSGFTRSFPADKKPKPAKLSLKPEHASYMKGIINFSPAKFNTGPDSKETAIVTSCGEYVIAWNFEKVKKGKLDSYQIKKYTGNVVEDNFSFGNDKDIIVTLQDDVLMIPKKALKKPGRQSLTSKPRETRSSIVNAPY